MLRSELGLGCEKKKQEANFTARIVNSILYPRPEHDGYDDAHGCRSYGMLNGLNSFGCGCVQSDSFLNN